MQVVKSQLIHIFEEIRSRKNLCHLKDWRALSFMNNQILLDAARIWPEVLPWKPKTILDVGAHRGAIAEQFAQLYRPSFIGLVEPLPQMIAFLQTKRFAPRQIVFPYALGYKEGIAHLNILSSMPSSSLLEVNPISAKMFHRPMDKVQVIPVKIRTLDDVFAECELEDLDLLKVDVQGYEIEVFSGGIKTLQKTRLIITEVSFFEHYEKQPLFREIYTFLNDVGFEVKTLFGHIYDLQGLPLQCDAVFINRKMSPYS